MLNKLSAHDLCDVGEIYIDVAGGRLSGNFDFRAAVKSGQLSQALRRAASAVDAMTAQVDTISYIDLDEGKLFAG